MNRLIPYSGEVYAYLVSGYGGAYMLLELAAILVIGVLVVSSRGAAKPAVGRAGAVFLAMLWAWIGVGFYWQTYQPLNWAGTYFGWAALVQTALIAGWGLVTGAFRPQFHKAAPRHWLGLAALILSASAGPFLHMFSGETPVAAQSIGVTPLATITATLALFLLNHKPVPVWLLPVPVLLLAWNTIRAAVLGLTQDGVLAAAAAVVLFHLLFRYARPVHAPHR